MHPVGRLDADTTGLLLFSRYNFFNIEPVFTLRYIVFMQTQQRSSDSHIIASKYRSVDIYCLFTSANVSFVHIGIPRLYEAIVAGTVNGDDLSTTLLQGVNTTEGTFSANLIESESLCEVCKFYIILFDTRIIIINFRHIIFSSKFLVNDLIRKETVTMFEHLHQVQIPKLFRH